MCGIIGYVGKDGNASSVLLGGLRCLEYRGYDSAGVAVQNGGSFSIVRSVGNLNHLENALSDKDLDGKTGIGHTRWATHGQPNEANAHPHTDCTKNIVVVHNGIIENYVELKRELMNNGHEFTSQTDSEVIAHLIEQNYDGNLTDAVIKAIDFLEGSFAIVAMASSQPDLIVGARKDSPMIVGLNGKENFIASATPAVVPYTNKIIFLEDNELVEISKQDVKLINLTTRQPFERKAVRVNPDTSVAQKGGYPDFMLKEIHEQPQAIRNTLMARFDPEGQVKLDELKLSERQILRINKVVFVACGTSYHAALVGKYFFEKWIGIDTSVEIASEFRYGNPVVDKKTLVIAITQSGETADTLAGVRKARERNAKVAAIVNVVGSLITREADAILYTHAGLEIGVAATKTLLAQLVAVFLLGLYLGKARGAISELDSARMIKELDQLPGKVEEILKHEKDIAAIAKQYTDFADFLFLGRGVGYPVALEGALKLKEISYIHAEGYPAGEMKHGPIALIDEKTPVLAIVTKGATKSKIISNVQESLARGAIVLAVATEGDAEISNFAKHIFWIPDCDEYLSAVLSVVPLQIFSYYVAKERGCDVDQPRNLAKSVTVE